MAHNAKKVGNRKIEIEPYKWVKMESEDDRSIMRLIVGTVAYYPNRKDYSIIKPVDNIEQICRLSKWDIEEKIDLINRYNAGERVLK